MKKIFILLIILSTLFFWSSPTFAANPPTVETTYASYSNGYISAGGKVTNDGGSQLTSGWFNFYSGSCSSNGNFFTTIYSNGAPQVGYTFYIYQKHCFPAGNYCAIAAANSVSGLGQARAGVSFTSDGSGCDSGSGQQSIQKSYYYCQDWSNTTGPQQRCSIRGSYYSLAECQRSVDATTPGKICYDNDKCNNACDERSKTQYYYCIDNSCQIAGLYFSDYECTNTKGSQCYISTNCDGKCSTYSGENYWVCGSSDYGCQWAGKFYSTNDCETANKKTCYKSSNCFNQCGQEFEVCNDYGQCIGTGKFGSIQACQSYPSNLGKTCYLKGLNCNNACNKRMWYCWGNSCVQTEKAYKNISECSWDIGKSCYLDNSCNGTCSSSGTGGSGGSGTGTGGTGGTGGSGTICDYDKVCEPSYGENSTNCSDCSSIQICNYNGICESYRGENSTNCSDCVSTTGCNYNGICEPARLENSSNCPDCASTQICNYNGICEISRGENVSNCPDCSVLSTQGYNCNKSTGFCTYVSSGAQYMTINQCIPNCTKDTSGYNCNIDGTCSYVFFGAQYSTQLQCSANCRPPAGLITARTLDPTEITRMSARFRGEITNRGGYSNLEYWFRYYKVSDGIWKATGIYNAGSYNSFGSLVSGLEANTDYCYHIIVQAVGTSIRGEGQLVCFKTLGTITPPGYNCNNGSCQVSAGAISDYPDLQACSFNCKSGAGWKCNDNGTCSSVSSGAQYSTQSACTQYCKPLPTGYNCVSGNCEPSYDFFPDYPNQQTCSAGCKNSAGWNCSQDGQCISVSSNAHYSNQNTCTQYCKSEITGYNCILGTCNPTYDFFADYDTQDSCNANCVDNGGAGWICNTDGTCSSVSQGGHYDSQSVCDQNCDALTPTGYNCILGSCEPSYDFFSDYPSQQTCSANCGITGSRWTCAIDGNCLQVSQGGEYPNQDTCNRYCKIHQEIILVQTDPASAVTQTSARLNGTLIDNANRPDLEYFFRYHENGDSQWIQTSITPISSEGAMFANISNLKPNTQYCYYVAVRIIDQGTEHRGQEVCFTTNPPAQLGIPILIYPINDEIVHTTLINFDWTDVSGAQIYEIWEIFGNDASTESIYYSDRSNLTAEIPELGRHYWKVRACQGVSNIRPKSGGYGIEFDGTANCGPWTEQESFRIADNQGITCTYGTTADGQQIDVQMQIDISPCSMNISFTDAIDENIAIQPGTRLRVGDRLIMNVGDPDSDWTVGSNNTVRHPISWIANARTAYTQGTSISPSYPFTWHLFDQALGIDEYRTFNVGVAATNPVVQNPDVINTLISENLSMTRLSPGRYEIVVLGEGTGEINLNVDDIFSYATVNGSVCGSGAMPGCSRNFSFALQGTIPDDDIPGDDDGTTTTTIPDGTSHVITTSTCINVSINSDGDKEITRNGNCEGQINATIYDVGRDEVLDRDAILRIENFVDDNGINNPPTVSGLKNNNPDWCLSQDYRLEWNFNDPDPGDSQSKYKISIYDQDGELLDGFPQEFESNSTGYQFSLVNRYGQDYSWEVEVWDQRGMSVKSERSQINNVPAHQYPSPLFNYNEVQLGGNDIEYKIWFADNSKSYGDSTITKYQWDFDGDGSWDKVFDTQEEISKMKNESETQLLYQYDSNVYKETILKITDSDGYSCEYLQSVTPEDFKYEDSPVENLNFSP